MSEDHEVVVGAMGCQSTELRFPHFLHRKGRPGCSPGGFRQKVGEGHHSWLFCSVVLIGSRKRKSVSALLLHTHPDLIEFAHRGKNSTFHCADGDIEDLGNVGVLEALVKG